MAAGNDHDASRPQPPGSVTVWQGRFLEVREAPWAADHLWEYVVRPERIQAAVVLAVTDAREVVLVEQYRPPLGANALELPAGLIGDETAGEAALASARRELLEETGFVAARWQALGEFASAPGLIGETYHFFRADGLSRAGAGGGVGHERIRVHLVPVARLGEFIAAARARGVVIDTRILIPLLHV